jgi:hypothetical protein
VTVRSLLVYILVGLVSLSSWRFANDWAAYLVPMDNPNPDKLIPKVFGMLQNLNSTSYPATDYTTSSLRFLSQFTLSTLLVTIIVVLTTYQCFQYFTSELPPIGSGLKHLPGPRSTLPYLGRIHDVDRMQAWTAMHKFSMEYNGLFSCTLGGETHIWVAREDVAQDLLVNNASLSSARADLGAYPGVTEDFKYLPLLGYTSMCRALEET